MGAVAEIGGRTRTSALRARVMERRGSFVAGFNPFVRDVALWRAVRAGRSRVETRAAFLLELVGSAPMEIGADWRLAGEHLIAAPDAGFAFDADAQSDADARLAELGVAPDDRTRIRETVGNWTHPPAGIGGHHALRELRQQDDGDREAFGEEGADSVYWAWGWMENHSVRDYAKVLAMGFGGIRAEVACRLADADIAGPQFPRQENFWRAALHVCEAGILLGKRYAEAAARSAKTADDPEERARLTTMAETCGRVPGQGARTFFEAVQALWLAHVLTCGEDLINANSIGRLDQILSPYYVADLRAGRITRDRAVEIMEELACKLYLDYDVQAITLGGLDRDGHDAVNELSHVILEATRNVDFARDVCVRLGRDSPIEFVELAADLIARGGGIPFIFNDDCFVKALSDRGIAVEDARDYAPIGCIELTVPGRANPHAVSGWLNSAKCLELALFDGRDPRSGEQMGPASGALTDFSSPDDLHESYRRQVEFFARRMVYHCNRGELAQRERGPLPCWSVLTDDCIARGRDITDGGAVYNYHSVCFLGTANTADSLMAIGKLLFDERRIDAAALLDALRADFDGHEPLRRMLLRRAPKYGNDCSDVDEIGCRVAEDFIALMDTMRSPLGGRYFVHLFSFVANIHFGRMTGATPDGRRAGEPLAYSLSAQQGRDESGVTALLNSLARLPHDRAAGATAAIIEIDPVLVEGRAGVERLAQMIRAAIAMGVGQLQWNVTTVERLERARDDPENYGNIPVRVAGFSQMFKLVDRQLQDHIIARTKHRR